MTQGKAGEFCSAANLISFFVVVLSLQFICGLSLCCGTQANLSREEIQKVVDVYRQPDGRVRYKEFCHIMENGQF